MGGASSFIKNSFENLKPICNVTRSQSTTKPTYKNEANVIFRAAAGRVSGFNQENGKMIVFRTTCAYRTHSYSQVHKIRANIKSGLDSDSQKSGVTNHVQIRASLSSLLH